MPNTTSSVLKETRERLLRRRDEEYDAMVKASAQYDKYKNSWEGYDRQIAAIELLLESNELTE